MTGNKVQTFVQANPWNIVTGAFVQPKTDRLEVFNENDSYEYNNGCSPKCVVST